MIIDRRFKDYAEFKIMKPYIFVGDESNDSDEFKDFIGWAWIDRHRNYTDHYENPVHGDCEDCYVIGFIEYENDNDEELWELLPN
jgi:hypothetical protein